MNPRSGIAKPACNVVFLIEDAALIRVLREGGNALTDSMGGEAGLIELLAWGLNTDKQRVDRKGRKLMALKPDLPLVPVFKVYESRILIQFDNPLAGSNHLLQTRRLLGTLDVYPFAICSYEIHDGCLCWKTRG